MKQILEQTQLILNLIVPLIMIGFVRCLTFKYLVKQNLFLISFQPLFAILVIKFYIEVAYESKRQLGFIFASSTLLENWWYRLLVYLSIMPVIILFLANHFSKKSISERAEKYELVGENLVSYVMTYIVPLTTLSIKSNLSNVIANIILFIVIMILYVRLNLTYLNPVLIFFGFSIYKIYTVQSNGEKYDQEEIKYIISKKSEDKFDSLFIGQKPTFKVHELGASFLIDCEN